MIDLEKVAEKAWNVANDADLDSFEACVVLRDAAMAIKQAQETIAQLEKDARRYLKALGRAKGAINSMKVEAETAAQGDEQMMLEACEQISNEGLAASQAIDTAMEASNGWQDQRGYGVG